MRRWLLLALGTGAIPLTGCRDSWVNLPGDPVMHEAEQLSALVALRIEVAGDTLRGVGFVPAGAGPHPVLLLLHGFPGLESNHDIAHAARRMGWTVAAIHYRGSWGSGGTFTFSGVLEDVEAAVAWVRTAEGREALRADPERVVLLGHSMGGWAALSVAARQPRVLGAGSLAGFDFGAHGTALAAGEARREDTEAAFAEGATMLDGTDGPALVREMLAAGDAWGLAPLATSLRGRPVFLVAARQDAVAPPPRHHLPLVRAYRAAGVRLREVEFDTDHGFGSRRVALTRAVLAWLQEVRGEARPLQT